jgi:type VI secretion system protein ImpK
MNTNQEKSAVNKVLHIHKDASPLEKDSSLSLAKNTASSHMLLHNKFILHNPKCGVNPLADAAAYIFSSIGKLKQLKSYRHINKLQKELISEINTFQDHAKTSGYSSEYILISRYALCATMDDIIQHTPWGRDAEWENQYSILRTFNQESASDDRFFVILERIIKDPALYIDVMELMYICLSLGYQGNYRHTEMQDNPLEKITHTLYKHIRAFHGDFSKALSPFPIKPSISHKTKTSKMSYVFTFFMTAIVILILCIVFSVLFENISNQAYSALTHIGKSTPYEPNTL